MITLDLDERTLLTIQNALWFTEQQAAAANRLIALLIQAQRPEAPTPEKPEKAAKVNGAHA